MLLASYIALLYACLLVAHPASAFTLPQVLSSNMVLQRAPAQARLWGTTLPSIPVSVLLEHADNPNVSTTVKLYSDDRGAFLVHLPPQPASLNWTLTVTPQHANESAQVLLNVAFGDVFLCTGQSNMQFSLPCMFDGEQAVANSTNYPNIRLFTVALAQSLTPLNDTISWWPNTKGWQLPSPKYVNGSIFDYFSSVCWVYGVKLHNYLGGKTPIGLLHDAYGGTKVVAWTSNASLAQCDHPTPPAVVEAAQSNRAVSRALFEDGVERLALDPNTPSVLFNALINPLLNVQVKAILWYQGQHNNSHMHSSFFLSALLTSSLRSPAVKARAMWGT
jgi:sialate O-acetylesterase